MTRTGLPGRSRRRVILQPAAGVLLFALGLFDLATDAEGWNAIWYVPAWYGYLLVLDALLLRLRGRSFLSGRRKELLSLMLWSVPFWFFFEAYNLRLRNWSYVFALRSAWGQAAVALLAFATVLPACLFHYELVTALGWWRRIRWPRIEWSGPFRAFWTAMAAACLLAPLFWPRAAFWMIWAAPFLALEPANRRSGSPSLLRDLERGRPARLLRLLAGGLWAGAVWEALNYGARSKWIYTVPGFEGAKLFEMPLPGFLGFPVLALSAFSFHSAASRWLASAEPSTPRKRTVRSLAAGAIALLFSAAVHQGMVARTVRSTRPVLEELAALDARSIRTLRAAGIPTPERLERAAASEGAGRLAARLGIEPRRLERSVRHATLALHKGMGPRAASQIEAAGVEGLADLCARDPLALADRVGRVASLHGEPAPEPAEVRVWVRSACNRDRPAR